MGTIVHNISTDNYRRRHAFQPSEHRFGSGRATVRRVQSTVLMLHGLSGISTGYDEVVDDLGDEC